MSDASRSPVGNFIRSTLDSLDHLGCFVNRTGLRFGSATINLRFSVDGATVRLVQRLLAAFDRTIVAPTGFVTPDYELCLALGAGTGIGAPPKVWPFGTSERDSFHRVHWDIETGLGLTSDEQIGVWNLADLKRGRGLVWISEADRLPSWEFSAPFRHHAHWIALLRQGAILHAATLADESSAFLLTGPGGSGKSTTTVVAQASGRCVLAEDLTWFEEQQRGFRVFPLYRTFKVTDAARRTFPLIDEFVAQHPHEKLEKTLVYGPGTGGAEALASKTLRVLYCLSAKFADTTKIEPCAPGLAFRLLAPSTVFLMRTAVPETSARLRSMIERLPLFHVTLGRDPLAAVDAIFVHFRELDAVRTH